MTQKNEDVKRKSFKERCLAYVEAHPRTGWYIACMATANFFLNLADLFHH